MRKMTHFKIYYDLGTQENECFDTQYQEKFSISPLPSVRDEKQELIRKSVCKVVTLSSHGFPI